MSLTAPSSPPAASLNACSPQGATSVPKKPVQCRSPKISLLSTHGDPNYIGLSGIDLSDGSGAPITLRAPKDQVKANPAGVHELPGLQDDPRRVENLFDGANLTSDAAARLAPFTPGERHEVTIEFDDRKELSVSRIRFFNYNASRAHAQRGVRHLEIRLDDASGAPIWGGELNVATARLVTDLVFTDDPKLLAKLRERDGAAGQDDDDSSFTLRQTLGLSVDRPSTAGSKVESDGRPSPASSAAIHTYQSSASCSCLGSSNALSASAVSAALPPRGGAPEPSRPPPPPRGAPVAGEAVETAPPVDPAAAAAMAMAAIAQAGAGEVTGNQLVCTVLSTWGDRDYFGLAGLELWGPTASRCDSI